MEKYSIVKKNIRIIRRRKQKTPAQITLVIPDELAEKINNYTLRDVPFDFYLTVGEPEITSVDVADKPKKEENR